MRKQKNERSSRDTSTPTEGQKFSEMLKNLPYSNDRVEQAFVRSWKGPLPEMKSKAENVENSESESKSSKNST